jgi:hypothetical protein
MTSLNSVTLPRAIGELFALNDHSVEYSVEVNGAEVDIIAKSISNPFMPTIYVEATVEYVNNDKYAKDLTKFAMLRNGDQQCICVSTEGFSAPVRERAAKTNIQTLTYDELFRKFEKFAPYIDSVISSKENILFNENYEEPFLSDSSGEVIATDWLNDWLLSSTPGRDWLIVLGEYGTGKTSLTRILQYRWLSDYKANPSRPIPLRIELRSFTRQFDGRALLHHFLDTNGLGHVPIDFLIYLMRKGRIVLLLDGYDEMAQFLNFRERRACLAALAEMSSYGAKGLLTSRPNYFTESEELKVFEALYDNLSRSKVYIGNSDKEFLKKEIEVDSLVERYILERYERSLKDLTPEQTTSLVSRILADDEEGKDVVLNLLARVFRDGQDGQRTSLSGKPVIISYLLELIDDLKGGASLESDFLSEWNIYKIIVDRLMLRDQQRATIPFDKRRLALQSLAVLLSQRNINVAGDSDFYEMIEKDFRNDLRRLSPDERQVRRTQLFEDLRSSSTLTRADNATGGGWMFSHNSLREFLCVEHYIEVLEVDPEGISVPISDAMRIFASTMPAPALDHCIDRIQAAWGVRQGRPRLGKYLTLLWDVLSSPSGGDYLSKIIGGDKGKSLLDGMSLSDVSFSGGVWKASVARDSEFSHVSFRSVHLGVSEFKNAVFDGCDFTDADMSQGDFSGCLIHECDLTSARVLGGNFTDIDTSSSFFVRRGGSDIVVLSGKAAIGYLAFSGAITSSVDDFNVLRFHRGYPIVDKIADRLISQRNGQYLGLTQKGEARTNPNFARSFVDFLVSRDLASIDKKKLVSLTSSGREMFLSLLQREQMSPVLAEFLRATGG